MHIQTGVFSLTEHQRQKAVVRLPARETSSLTPTSAPIHCASPTESMLTTILWILQQYTNPTMNVRRLASEGNPGGLSAACAVADDSIGPALPLECRGGFDFTLFFEQAFLIIAPNLLMIVLSAARLAYLQRHQAVCHRDLFCFGKQASQNLPNRAAEEAVRFHGNQVLTKDLSKLVGPRRLFLHSACCPDPVDFWPGAIQARRRLFCH